MLVRLLALGFCATWVLSVGGVYAQNYPTKPIRIVAPGAGGSGDFISRLIGQNISGPLGQPVIVDNRDVYVQRDIVLKAPPDGQTLLLSGSAFWVDPFLQKLPYDPVRDFIPLSMLSQEVYTLVVTPSLPVNSVKDLIALAQAKPGTLNYAYNGVGGPQRLSAELLKSLTGINIVGVPYKTSVQTASAVLSGEVQLAFSSAAAAMPQIKAGKLKALAVTSSKISAVAPGVPTVAASGVPGYEYIQMTGIFAPAKTPDAIVRRLNQEIVRALNQPEAKERMLSIGQEVIADSPEQSAVVLKAELAKWGKLLRDLGIKPE